jgi:hypothetical protein
MKIKNIKYQNYRSQTLIEVVIAVGLGITVIVALALLGHNISKSSVQSVRREEALRLANAGIETVKYVKNEYGFDHISNNMGADLNKTYAYTIASPDACAPDAGLYCLGNILIQYDTFDNRSKQKILSNPNKGNLTYTRELTMTKTSDTLIKVRSSVIWDDGNFTDSEKLVKVETLLGKY